MGKGERLTASESCGNEVFRLSTAGRRHTHHAGRAAHVGTRQSDTPAPDACPLTKSSPQREAASLPGLVPTLVTHRLPRPSPLRTLQSSRPDSPQLGQAGGSQGPSSPPQRTSGPTSVWLWRLRTQLQLRAVPQEHSRQCGLRKLRFQTGRAGMAGPWEVSWVRMGSASYRLPGLLVSPVLREDESGPGARWAWAVLYVTELLHLKAAQCLPRQHVYQNRSDTEKISTALRKEDTQNCTPCSAGKHGIGQENSFGF